MTTEQTRTALRSEAKLVVVEAAAGCGKTHEAVEAAIDLARSLQRGQEVLLLAHTNGAVHEFQSRIAQTRARVRARTLDAFASEIVSPYARPLGLPDDLRLGSRDGVPFSDLAPALASLLARAPSVARALARHYPVILLDEHQDARTDQHLVARSIHDAGPVRMRIFGDPLQAIYAGMGDDDIVDWDALKHEADVCGELVQHHRWSAAPALGQWVHDARVSLLTGVPVPTRDVPAEVRVVRVPRLRPERNPRNRRIRPELFGPLGDALDQDDGRMGILVSTRYHAMAIRAAARRRVLVEEGHDLAVAVESLEAAAACEGNARRLGLEVLAFFSKIGVGVTKQLREPAERALAEDRFVAGRRPRAAPFVEPLAELYDSPSLTTWCRVVATISRQAPEWLKVDLTQSARAIAAIAQAADPREELERVLAARRTRTALPRRCVTTIHKSKGRDFDHVVLPSCCEMTFPANEQGRRLLYVALSRAKRGIRLFLPEVGASRLLQS